MSADHVVAGTGSRSLQTADRDTCARAVAAVRDHIAALIKEHGDRLVLMSGMAEGFDHLIALAALQWNVRLWAAIPNRGYGGYYWGRNSLTGTNRLAEFTSILNAAWRVTYVMEEVHRARGLYLNGVHSNFARNQFMVDTAAEILAWEPTSRGTKDCVERARAAGKPVRDLSAPADIEALIEASSLGTPDAVAMRERTTPEQARRVMERAEQIAAEEE